jgi:glycosyltransferase involved in cell wall biosynthesis
MAAGEAKNPVATYHPMVLAIAFDDAAKAELEERVSKELLTVRVETRARVGSDVLAFLNPLFSSEWHVLLTYGGSWMDYDLDSLLPRRLARKWIHVSREENLSGSELFRRMLSCYLTCNRERHTAVGRAPQRPAISIFTTAFHSYDKILRVKRSLERQTLLDWEWVIMDDSKDDASFQWLREHVSAGEHRVRLYRRDFHCGSIGAVKNETVLLCRAPYVLEVDHDDELLPWTLEEIVAGFTKFPEVGFVYMNFAECYEDRRPFDYGPSWAFGYGGYRDEVHDGVLYKVALSCDINDVTMSNIVGVPNHPRAWRKSVLLELGNYSEYLSVADDYEILVLTARFTKMLKIDRLGYIQFKNAAGNNFSILRNKEITKLQGELSRLYYQQLDMPAFFASKGVTESKERKNACINLTVASAIDHA